MIDLIIQWGIFALANIILGLLVLSLIRIKKGYWFVIRTRQLLLFIFIYLAILGAWMAVYYPNMTVWK